MNPDEFMKRMGSIETEAVIQANGQEYHYVRPKPENGLKCDYNATSLLRVLKLGRFNEEEPEVRVSDITEIINTGSRETLETFEARVNTQAGKPFTAFARGNNGEGKFVKIQFVMSLSNFPVVKGRKKDGKIGRAHV